MKKSIYFLGFTLLLGLFLMPSCKKDELILNESLSNETLEFRQDMNSYDSFGDKLRAAIDASIHNVGGFKLELIKATQKMPTGDYEVLLSSLLKEKNDDEKTMKEVLLENARGSFSEAELDSFLAEHPSVIVSTRGSILSWANNHHIPAVVFVPSNFDETTRYTEGMQNGEVVEVDLTTTYKDCMITISISERHDKNGELIQIKDTNYNQPSIDRTRQVRGGEGINCVEPTECVDILVTDFNVTQQDGGIKISYDIQNLDPSLCQWLRITILREGPADINGNPSFDYIYRTADQGEHFFDIDYVPGMTYTYTLVDVQLRFIDPFSSPSPHNNTYINCNTVSYAPWVIREHSIISPFNNFLKIHTFRGENISSSQILYRWEAPLPSGISEYRLSVLEETSPGVFERQVVTTLDANVFEYPYTYSPEDRGKYVDMRIEYRGTDNIWKGDYYDRTYASFRDSGEPFRYYGFYNSNIAAWEQTTDGNPWNQGENPVYGAPEIRILATRASNNFNGPPYYFNEPINTYKTTTPCLEVTESQPITQIIGIDPLDGTLITTTIYIDITEPNGYYLFSSGPIDILTHWDNYLFGSSMNIYISETDALEVQTLNVNTSNSASNTLNVSANIGIKIPIINAGVQVGHQSTHTSTETVVYGLPTGEWPIINGASIHYHYDKIYTNTNHLFGTLPADVEVGGIDCNELEYILENN